MHKVHKYLYLFTRSRARREMKIDKELKDFSKDYNIQKQYDVLRQEHEQQVEKTFSQVLKEQKPKLKERFHINKIDVNKKIKKVYKETVQFQNIKADDDDLSFLSLQKSHLYDNKAEIEYEEKFKKKLFVMRQTKRLIEKKVHNVETYAEEDVEFMDYQQNKNKLKNKRIQNMLNFSKNNEKLQLLIESGLINDDDSLKKLIDGRIEEKQALLEGSMNNEDKQESSKALVIGDQDQIQKSSQNQKIGELIQSLGGMNDDDAGNIREDIDLLLKIKQYETKLFNSRYQAINFRFKGQVDFNYFHEHQLITYIKNQTIHPEQLLLVYSQNKNKISKFNLPIITPPVLANMYSKTSLYRFPQTETNNRINMLNDSLFKSLEQSTFKNLFRLNDTDFISAVWSYAKNHEDEQGILNMAASNKINSAIFGELPGRIDGLTEEDLGLLMRSLQKLPLTQLPSQRWDSIVEKLSQKLSQVKNTYTTQSILNFLVTIPESQLTLKTVKNNIRKLNEYEWTQNETLSCFIFCSSFMLKNRKKLKNSSISLIQKMLIKQNKNLQKLIQSYSINKMPQFLTVFRQSKAFIELERLTNKTKKIISQNIKQQKQQLQENKLVLLISNLTLIDYYKYLDSRKSKIIKADSLSLGENLMRKQSIRMLIPSRIIPFNSSYYFIYHDMVRLIHNQKHMLSVRSLSQMLESLSMVKYKNQTFYDELVHYILNKVDGYDQANETNTRKYSKQTTMKILCSILNTFGYQRRKSELYNEILFKILDGQIHLLNPNEMIKVVVNIVSLMNYSQIKESNGLKEAVTKIYEQNILILVEKLQLIQEQLISLVYVGAILKVNSQIMEKISQQLNQFNFKNSETSFINAFRNVLAQKNQQNERIFQREQRKYKTIVLKDMAENQSEIGAFMPYESAFNNMYEQLKEKYGQKDVVKRSWSFEVPSKKKVYFLATYDHIFSRFSSSSRSKNHQISISLHGLWKLYENYYEQWQLCLVPSFLQN